MEAVKTITRFASCYSSSCNREMADQEQQKLLDRLLNAGGITPSLEMEKVGSVRINHI